MGDGQFRQPDSAQGVVFDRLTRLPFHHRHVFVRSGVKNGRRLVVPQHRLHPRLIQYVGNDRNDHVAVAELEELLFDREQLHLRLINKQQAARAKRGNLPAQFAADAAAGAGDQYGAVLQHVANLVQPEVNGFAPEQVLDLDGPQLADTHNAGGQLVNAWDRHILQPRLLKQADDFTDAFGRGGRHRDDCFLQVQFQLRVLDQFRCSEYRDAVNLRTPFAPVVVEQSDGHKAEVRARI